LNVIGSREEGGLRKQSDEDETNALCPKYVHRPVIGLRR
jgi:hypothetical protein